MEYRVNIGLEVHIELNTKNKMFCKCKSSFGDEKNKNICPICVGMPGSLPIPNIDAIELAIKTGLATNCKIDKTVSFDRKNYFYKDLPKGYQISQFYNPICKDGYINLKNKTVNIREIHIEEDAGKISKDSTIDYNRAGIPLLELVTRPDFENEEEVIEFLKRLTEILLFCNVSDCKIQEGSIRVDVNLSVRKENETLGNRVELKNLGSFKAIKDAINYEIKRHISVLESGNSINIETRKYDEDNGITVFMRNKETAEDYRYLKDPDIANIRLSDQYIANIEKNMPQLPEIKRKIYSEKYNLIDEEISIILSKPMLDSLFQSLVVKLNNPREIVNLITGELLKIIKEENIDIDNLNINTDNIANLINIFLENKISRDTYKKVFYKVIVNNIEPLSYVKSNDLFLIDDKNYIENTIKYVLSQNVKVIEDYKNGKQKAFKYLIGQCVKEFQGKCDINTIKDTLNIYINNKL